MASALLLGVLCVQRFPALPPLALAIAMLITGTVLWARGGALRPVGAFVLGLGLAGLHGASSLALRLPESLAGRELQIEGQVLGLPLRAPDSTRFEFRVTAGEGEARVLMGRKLRLGWYTQPPVPAPQVEPGSTWRFRVKLRPPRGLVNPGGFDFERRALEQRLAATGQVLDPPDHAAHSASAGLDALRGRLSAKIHAALAPDRARFVAALALGDTRSLSDHDWTVLRANGLTHLIAISGFHVGLVAGFGALLAQLAYRLLPSLGRRWPRPQGCAAAALMLAAAYTALAGFALPTVRTLLMIAAIAIARLARRPQGLSESLAFALLGVLLIDPLAVLAPGFWLSFLGVAWLVWCLPPDPRAGVMRPFLHAQGVAMIGLLPLTVWFFSQASLPGPLVNLVGIPWISLVVVPLCLLGIAVSPLSDAGASLLWQGAGETMQWLWWLLEEVAAWPAALVWLPEPSLWAVVLALAGAFWLLLPRGVPGKALALLLWLPLLYPRPDVPAEGDVDLLMLDVGQGLSLLVQTRHHSLLYDAGPAIPRGLDLGEAVVVPALRARGLSRLDRLLLSHGDNDHAGGADAVAAAFAPDQVLAAPGWARPGMRACEAGQQWQWDGVHFTVLHPPRYFPYQRNDSSCVLRIDAGGGSVLLAGDIGRHVEARLARLPASQVRADVLLVPHHGSDTSSSLGFLAAVRPSLGLLAVGHDNRFGLPKARVLDRYARYGVSLHDSAGSGAISVRLSAAGRPRVQGLRQAQPRYWRHAGEGGSGYAIAGPEPDR
ncbi:DNA internalization-related competence protein ComEC/Rec2 [Arenimonas sp. MALMAid1274]|uniref:DNA internalization-related competence protein ComEC/Rec2 n=1 Tax=Arenimonas sp. MALMAid1274 TaxID=3411630 RepID=UPI003B9F8AFF